MTHQRGLEGNPASCRQSRGARVRLLGRPPAPGSQVSPPPAFPLACVVRGSSAKRGRDGQSDLTNGPQDLQSQCQYSKPGCVLQVRVCVPNRRRASTTGRGLECTAQSVRVKEGRRRLLGAVTSLIDSASPVLARSRHAWPGLCCKLRWWRN